MAENAEKLRKTLLLALYSDKPGEVIAARNAFLRLYGQGPHEAADNLLSKKTETIYPGGDAKQPRSSSRENSFCKITASRILDSGMPISDKEYAFLYDMIDWERPSEKQRKWLGVLYLRSLKWS